MVILALGWFLAINAFLPHGDLDQRILEISRLIEASPDSIELRVIRGELYIQHEEYDKAKVDFTRCVRNGLADTRTLLGLSHSYLYTGPVDSSLYYVSIVLSQEPDHIPALELKFRGLDRKGEYCESAITVQRLISLADYPAPLLFVQAASAWNSCDEEGNVENAIHILREGINKLPQNRVLKNKLISLYTQTGLYEEALEVHSSIIAQSTFKSRPLLNRAKLYIEISSFDAARADLDSALLVLESLPEHKETVQSMVELKREIVTLLAELKN